MAEEDQRPFLAVRTVKAVVDTVVGFFSSLRLTVLEFYQDFCHQRAAALAFTSVFAIIPLTAIFLYMINITGFLNQYRDRAQEIVLEHFAPESQQAVERFLGYTIDNIRNFSHSSGLVGFVAFVGAGILLLLTIEGVFNEIWKVRKARPLMKRVFAFWFVLCFIPITLAASAYIETRVEGSLLLHDFFSGTMIHGVALRYVLPILLTYLCFFVPYVHLPNTRVRYRYAAAGALLAGSLWEVAKGGFKAYLTHSVDFFQIYGSLAAVPILFLWVYLSWLIVLFGAEFTYVLQHNRALRRAPLRKHRSNSLSTDALAVLLATEIARRFARGEPPAAIEDLTARLGIFPREALEILKGLEKGGILAYVTDDELLVLTRGPETIKVREVAEAVRKGIPGLKETVPADLKGAVNVLDRIQLDATARFGELTLKDLLS